VLNLEYNKWDETGCTPEHELTVPFTRMLAGPLDFHQGSFRGVRVEQFKPRNIAPQVMGTPSRNLASYVVFQNHLPMIADYPSSYRGHPGLQMLAKIPTTWDDTKVLNGIVGEQIVIARRYGKDWYIGAMNDRRPREFDLPLRFLGSGHYRAEIYAADNRQLSRRMEEVTSVDVLKLRLESADGVLIHLTPLSAKTTE
jgi:alpha-glucosidase